jgi:hypothetical protein
VSDLGVFLRYARGFKSFLREPVSGADARQRVQDGVRNRPTALLHVLEHAIYGHPSSPYRALLLHAGIELEDVRRLVDDTGVEATLERLHAEGVHVGLDEFKGRRGIERPGLRLDVRPEDFDSPLIGGSASIGSTGGSRGPRRRVMLDYDHRLDGAICQRLFLETFELFDRPIAVWRAAPPGAAGIGTVVGFAKAGAPVERWFSHNRLIPRRGVTKEFLFTAYTVAAGRTSRTSIPWPSYVPLSRAGEVARWLAQKRGEGTPAFLVTTASSGVRACVAAEQLGLDITGTFLRLGGEPLTPAKAAAMERAGARPVSNYTMSELGRIGLACAQPTALDDLHVMTDRLAVIQRERAVGNGAVVGALLYTTLRATSPKVMLNVESDDYGTLEQRECGCLLGELGLTTHVHDVRSYEKLTSEGMTFIGTELIDLVDDVLPARFGGRPTDYQLVEEEVDGIPKVAVVIDPRVGDVEEGAVIAAVLCALGSGPGYKAMMADAWRDGGTLRVVRREPYATGAGKVLPLHVVRDG